MSTQRPSAPNSRLLLRRMLLHLVLSLTLLAASLGIGIWGYATSSISLGGMPV